ncbi:unnamed protein product [Discosporangium mesarthrocarpum]
MFLQVILKLFILSTPNSLVPGLQPIQLSTYINARFANEPLVSALLPIDGSNADEFFSSFADGTLLNVLVDAACEGAVNLRPLRRRAEKPLGVSKRHLTIQHYANLNEALQGCEKMGLRLGFVGAEDFAQGNRPVILGVTWQLVRLAIMREVSLMDSPELEVLFSPDGIPQETNEANQEELLRRWFNHYLEVSGSERRVWAFGPELADGVAYCILLNGIDPTACPPPDEMDMRSNPARAAAAAGKMGVKGVFVGEEGIQSGDRKTNLMFCAQLFHAHPHLLPGESHEPKRQSLDNASKPNGTVNGSGDSGSSNKTVPLGGAPLSKDLDPSAPAFGNGKGEVGVPPREINIPEEAAGGGGEAGELRTIAQVEEVDMEDTMCAGGLFSCVLSRFQK